MGQRTVPPPAEWYVPKDFPYTHTHINELGEWPQRLLHIPSMTSYAWTPGHCYNGQKEPLYRCISYTWGRWRLRDYPTKQKPEVGPVLEIRGVSWSIPRIDPVHFNREKMEQMIRGICASGFHGGGTQDKRGPDSLLGSIETDMGTLPAVEFVWLDLACIDQRPGPLASVEVGRQAGIFRGSSGVAVWLSRTGSDSSGISRLKGRLALLEDVDHFQGDFSAGSKCCSRDYKIQLGTEEQEGILGGVQELLRDPWFSSLWTLQEAFISRQAFFVLSSADPLILDTSGSRNRGKVYSLDRFTSSCRSLTSLGSLTRTYLVPTPGLDIFTEKITDLVRDFGVDSMASDVNHMSLLASSGHRETTRDVDRVYGIMQVFGFKLGSSRLGAHPEAFFDASTLEVELGKELLEDRPVQSQLFVFIRPAERGQGWRMSRWCRVYDELSSWVPEGALAVLHASSCQLSTYQALGDETTYGRFDDVKVCWLANINTMWDRIEDCIPAPLVTGWWYGARRFSPDASPLFSDSPEATGSGLPIDIPNDRKRQRAFGRYICTKFESNKLIVLHLTIWAGQHFGILLLQVNVDAVSYWHRLGIVM